MDVSKRRARLVGVIAAVATGVLAATAIVHPGAASGRPGSYGAPAARSATLAVVRTASPTTDRRTLPRPPGSTAPAPGDQPGRASGGPAHPPADQATAARPTVRPSSASVAAQLLAGTGPIPAGWVATAHTVDTGGLSRAYLTLEPAHPTRALPIVLLLHGRGMTPDTILHITGLADRIGPAVLVVPAGWDRSWNAGDCCGAAYRAGVGDVRFIRTVLASVVTSTPGGQESKVYAVGFSNGGRMAYLLACDMPGTFAGFVAVEAVPVEACTPPRPLDMTIVAQQSDPLLTVDSGRPKEIGGFMEPTVAATVARMETVDHCAGPPDVQTAGRAVERTWSCAGGTSLRYVWYPAGAHNWRAAVGSTPGATDFVMQTLGWGGVGQRFSAPGATATAPAAH